MIQFILPSAPVTRLHPQIVQHLQTAQHLQILQHLQQQQHPQTAQHLRTAQIYNYITADVNANTGWKCTQTLDTPSGYNGGAIRLELIQDVNGEPKASTIIDGQNISFPYQFHISGAEGVTSGTIYLYEEVDGDYQQLGPTRLHSRKLSDHAGKDNQRYCRILLRICRRR